MLERIRSRLTYANVASSLALFLVVGGGTALASYVVSSNSQIGPGTISGHSPPAAAHSNLIQHSVNAQDLAPSSVNSAAIQNGQVGPLDLNVATTKATSMYKDGPTSIALVCDPSPPFGCSDPPPLITLNLPKGNYVVIAKLYLANNSGSEVPAGCLLTAGGVSGDTDQESVYLGQSGHAASELPISLNVNHVFSTGSGNVMLSCESGLNVSFNPDVEALQVKVTAMRASYLLNTPAP
jgi:hypothetical protein